MPEELSQEEVFSILDEIGAGDMEETEAVDHLVEEHGVDPVHALAFVQDYRAALEEEEEDSDDWGWEITEDDEDYDE